MVWCGVCVLCCRGDGALYVLCILPLGTPATPSSVQCTECLQACFQAPCACMCRYVAAQAARRHTVVPCAPSTGVRCAFSLSCFNMSNWRHYTSLHSLPVYQFCIIALVQHSECCTNEVSTPTFWYWLHMLCPRGFRCAEQQVCLVSFPRHP